MYNDVAFNLILAIILLICEQGLKNIASILWSCIAEVKWAAERKTGDQYINPITRKMGHIPGENTS